MMFNKPKLRQLLTILVSISTLGITVMNSDAGNAQNSPNNQQRPSVMRHLGPFTPPEQAHEYILISSSTQITGRLSLPAAYLNNPPPKFAQEIAVLDRTFGIDVDGTRVNIPPDPPGRTVEQAYKPDERAEIMIASVRYRGSGHTVYVNTATLSPAYAKEVRFVETTKLADGTPVAIFENINEESKTPNQLVLVKGKVYVTIASDLPMEQIKSLATSVVLKK
jgi:hypothetical protein